MIRVKGNVTVKITLKYERLPHFCFLCGLMSHTEKDCSIVSDEEKESGQGWGMDIRTSPRKGFAKNKEEVELLKLKKCLFVPKPKCTPVSLAVSKQVVPKDNENLLVNKTNHVEQGSCIDNGVVLLSSNKKGNLDDDVGHDSQTKVLNIKETLGIAEEDSNLILLPNPTETGVVESFNSHDEVSLAGPQDFMCPAFHIGKSSSSSRKVPKVKKRLLDGNKSLLPSKQPLPDTPAQPSQKSARGSKC